MRSELRQSVEEILNKAKSVVFGQDNMLEAIMAALTCEGHLLIEGMPGLGKTLSVSTMSKLCALDFKRIQFTPDLLPSDLIGTMIYNQQKEEFSTKLGPVFTQILLADEINRSPAKVQSALLEAMAEKQVTIGDNTHPLKSPFVVLATQNPIEQEGTYNLPEAQLDRFMMKIQIDYPSYESELSILGLKTNPHQDLGAILRPDTLMNLQKVVNETYVDDKIKEMVVNIVHATRPDSPQFLKKFEGAVVAGASPRASIWLYKISKFRAFLNDRDYVTPDDLMEILPDVLCHRIILSYEAALDKMDIRKIVREIASKHM